MEFQDGLVRTLGFSTPIVARSFLANMKSLWEEVEIKLAN
jgi:hypothetical protein